ncbi:MAG: hypothetical protein A3C79_01185 [Candidatus Taylorbacteria bacterium RIFCSPHIGHO2_02_FULL_45_28]|uniref:Uncharacterized protein n=1 Tax=Candidatus Taylorbacteria bacterium RIFCSPHIGHO2_12_FULL_45_16 TaxID=1802315 RepID=A0A1G2MZB6_9BACT|nr:MAG: hypothetical protein A2830_02440 [Candidatus Taylorbacteria bacterium RIFCSPHIGHO2_01_FULL_44_110]OHA25629.1 MAG: hypothetical protein A3C79_01185 [Candidatus Taylorbacteria bacterium RIFCSPHIGHO2_02_FULL_45_28]OHA29295.1 MAG: hypothetical protein A3F51_01650 [Candidatus Taylorbacteria bacterium RIFCSPHIGHO2_12_FULL_45_16]OHA33517.1 MAG: hypothetical protein A3A23_02530 [Candidatus Taylorbacteria bacterium RIFCSPLOWO2_01_FULL_45_59]OHA39141.1 MAG: hypothetical protein A3I98_00880 [Candi
MKKFSKKNKKIVGSISLERFVHFQCGSCRRWWGIGDAPIRKEWYCPWCAVKQTFVDKMSKDLS